MSRLKTTVLPGPPAEPQRSWTEWIAWVATEDHCEWSNRYVIWIKTPLGVLATGALCSLLCGLFVSPQGYVLFTAIASVVAVGLAWPFVAVRGIRCRLLFETRRGREGRASTARLIVTNRWPWPVWGLAVNDPLFSGGKEAALALARVEGWSTATFNCSLTPSQRGVYPNREVDLSTGFPFGLYQASRPADVPRRFIVWPQTFWLPPLSAATGRSHWRGSVSDARSGNEGTRLGVRDHRVGDSLRDVHWAKTARYDRLIVSERESVNIEHTTVIVDLDPAAQAGLKIDPTLEWRLRIAASLCESFAANQGLVDLWLGGMKVSAGRSVGDFQRLLDEVAQFDPSGAPTAARVTSRIASGVVITISANGMSIVLRRSGSFETAQPPNSQQAPWIEVDSLDDVPGQVLRRWRLNERRVSRAS